MADETPDFGEKICALFNHGLDDKKIATILDEELNDFTSELLVARVRVLEEEAGELEHRLSDHDRAEVERCRKEVAEEGYEKLKKAVAARPLRLEEGSDNDYVLQGDSSVWIRIDNIAVWVRRTERGVAVELFPTQCESQNQLDSCETSFEAAAVWKCPECGEFNETGRALDDEGYCPTCRD